MRKISKAQVEKLTAIQKQCLRLVADGLRSKEIAAQVKLSHRTVDTYITSALAIFETSDRRNLARDFVAYEAGLQLDEANADPIVPTENAAPGASQRLPSQSQGVAEAPISAIDDGEANEQAHLLNSFKLPPIGGHINDLTVSNRVLSITRIGLAGAITLLAIVAIVQGIISLLT